MSFECTSVCEERSFVLALTRLNLVKSRHCSSENPISTLVSCLSTIRPRTEVMADIQSLKEGSDDRIPIEARSLYLQGLNVEYGPQKALVTPLSCPNVALLAAISYLYDLDIFVVCGILPLRKFRSEANRGERDVLRFSFGRTGSSKLVVGMFGLGIYHRLEQPAADSVIWSTLSRRAVPINNDYFELTNSVPEATVRPENFRETADEVAMAEDPNLEVERIDPVIPEDTENDMISMQTYVNRCISYDSSGAVLDPNAYNVPERISAALTSQEDFGTQAIQRLEQNVDIDGFFGFWDWRSATVFRGNVNLCSTAQPSLPRDQQTFARLLRDPTEIQVPPIMYKLALCRTNFGIIDLFYALVPESPITSIPTVNNVIQRAFDHAKEAKCVDSQGHLVHPGCTSFAHRTNTDAYRPVEARNPPSYDRHRYACFCFHFARAVIRGLADHGIRVSRDFAYAQAVGMKFVMHSESINGILDPILKLNDIIDLTRIRSQYDISFSTVGISSDPDTKVSKVKMEC